MMIPNKMKYLFSSLFMLYSVALMGQQDPMFTQYTFNMLAVNPGYAGSHGAINVTGMYRNQWVGIEGAPVTQTFFAHSPFMSRKVGVGLSVINDKIGPVRQTMLFADYSYTINVTENSKLAMGLKAGMNILKTSFGEMELIDDNDESFNDVPITPQPNFGFGLYYFTDKYYLGVSVPKLINNKLEQKLDYSKLTMRQHFFMVAGYVYTINEHLKFKPSSLIKITGSAPLSLDLNASFLFREKLWFGAGYRFGDSFCVLMEVQITNQLKFGYSFDQTVSKLSKYNSGTHEIMLSYDFVFKKDKIISPRYF